jgi:uncharacterized protein YfaS (alpha-2-macroglobulin family)
MKTVRKYYLNYGQDAQLTLPSGANILEIQEEESGAGGQFSFQVWAEIDDANPDLTLDFRIITDEDEFRAGEPASLTHVQTVPVNIGRYKIEGYHIYLK